MRDDRVDVCGEFPLEARKQKELLEHRADALPLELGVQPPQRAQQNQTRPPAL